MKTKKIKASPPLGSLSRALTGVLNTSTTNLPQTKPDVNDQHSVGKGFDEMAEEATAYKALKNFKGKVKLGQKQEIIL